MAHYRLVGSFLSGLFLFALLSACGGPEQLTNEAAPPLIISDTGIGPVEIGYPAAAAIEELTGLLGGPDVDTRWIDGNSELYGKCPAEKLRAVGWGSLYLFFTAGDDVTADTADLVGHLFTYSYGFDFSRNEGGTDPRELSLTTAAGIGIGSTRSELRLAYEDDLAESHDATTDIWAWDVAASAPSYLRGLLSGPGADATIVLIERVPGCGEV